MVKNGVIMLALRLISLIEKILKPERDKANDNINKP